MLRIKKEQMIIRERLLVLFTSSEIKLCRLTRGDTREARVSGVCYMFLFMYKLAHKNPGCIVKSFQKENSSR